MTHSLILPTIQLPKDKAFNLAWFSDRLRARAGSDVFIDLLRHFDPVLCQQLQEQRAPMQKFIVALLNKLSQLFPTFDPYYLYDEDIRLDVEVVYNALTSGMPMDLQGVGYEEPPSSPAIALCKGLYEANSEEGGEIDLDQPALVRYRDLLDAWLSEKPAHVETLSRCPKGRTWRDEWGSVNPLVKYAVSATGNAFLDYDNTSFYEGYSSGPNWDLREIKALAAEWKRGGAMLKKINALAERVDRAPEKNLPLLAGAITRDPDTLQKITKPKR